MARAQSQLDGAALRRALRCHAEVDAAYIFGSHAYGRPKRHSDLDVGVFINEPHLRRRRLPATYEIDLALEIATITRIPKVEVVVLNSASPLLAWEAVRHGRRVFERRRTAVIAHEMRARQRYLDTAVLRAIQDRYLDDIVRRGFSKALRP